jgi:hypothetical protein
MLRLWTLRYVNMCSMSSCLILTQSSQLSADLERILEAEVSPERFTSRVLTVDSRIMEAAMFGGSDGPLAVELHRLLSGAQLGSTEVDQVLALAILAAVACSQRVGRPTARPAVQAHSPHRVRALVRPVWQDDFHSLDLEVVHPATPAFSQIQALVVALHVSVASTLPLVPVAAQPAVLVITLTPKASLSAKHAQRSPSRTPLDSLAVRTALWAATRCPRPRAPPPAHCVKQGLRAPRV